MTMRFVHTVEYRCDSCGLKVAGTDSELPPGWSVEHGEKATLHYCPSCQPAPDENLAPVAS